MLSTSWVRDLSDMITRVVEFVRWKGGRVNELMRSKFSLKSLYTVLQFQMDDFQHPYDHQLIYSRIQSIQLDLKMELKVKPVDVLETLCVARASPRTKVKSYLQKMPDELMRKLALFLFLEKKKNY